MYLHAYIDINIIDIIYVIYKHNMCVCIYI